jgi:hypothetical protein
MLKSDDIAKLSSDDLCVLDQKVVELLVVRIEKRSRELAALLSQLPPGSNKQLPKAIRRSARISEPATRQSASGSSSRQSDSSIGGKLAKSASQSIKRPAGRPSR